MRLALNELQRRCLETPSWSLEPRPKYRCDKEGQVVNEKFSLSTSYCAERSFLANIKSFQHFKSLLREIIRKLKHRLIASSSSWAQGLARELRVSSMLLDQ